MISSTTAALTRRIHPRRLPPANASGYQIVFAIYGQASPAVVCCCFPSQLTIYTRHFFNTLSTKRLGEGWILSSAPPAGGGILKEKATAGAVALTA